MFYQPVVLEEGNVVHRGLDSKNQTEFIVHLDGNRTHAVFDPSPLDSGVEGISHLTFILLVELSSEESCDVLGLDGVDGGAGQMPIDELKVLLMLEYDVGCILGLHDAPVITLIEAFDDRAESLCKEIEPCVKQIDFEGITKPLSLVEIRYLGEGVIEEAMMDI